MCRGKLSDFKDLSFGVPQGSILGPFLFLLFINDISSFAANECVINLFDDDLLTYVSGKGPSRCSEETPTVCHQYM